MTSEWTPYYEYAGDDPRETLLGALDRFAEPGLAVDLGCGSGRDTFELLRRGWRVLAIDAEREALERLQLRPVRGPLEQGLNGDQTVANGSISRPRY